MAIPNSNRCTSSTYHPFTKCRISCQWKFSLLVCFDFVRIVSDRSPSILGRDLGKIPHSAKGWEDRMLESPRSSCLGILPYITMRHAECEHGYWCIPASVSATRQKEGQATAECDAGERVTGRSWGIRVHWAIWACIVYQRTGP